MVLDRFEEDLAVIETDDGGHITVPREQVNAHEGDFLVLTDGVYTSDTEKTEELRREIAALQNSLWE